MRGLVYGTLRPHNSYIHRSVVAVDYKFFRSIQLVVVFDNRPASASAPSSVIFVLFDQLMGSCCNWRMRVLNLDFGGLGGVDLGNGVGYVLDSRLDV